MCVGNHMLYKESPGPLAGAYLIPFLYNEAANGWFGAAGVSVRCGVDASLAAKTMQFLLAYEYGTELVIKLANAMR